VVHPVEGNPIIFSRGTVIENETPGEGEEKERLRDEQKVASISHYEDCAGGVVNG
jgi:hypothetical protein